MDFKNSNKKQELLTRGLRSLEKSSKSGSVLPTEPKMKLDCVSIVLVVQALKDELKHF